MDMNSRMKRRALAATVAVASVGLATGGATLGYATTNDPSPGQSSAGNSPSTKATRTVNVSSVAELVAALAAAKAGDVITMAAGTYDSAFFATADGTSAEPITLTGPKGAVLTNTKKGCDPNVPSGRSVTFCSLGFHLNGASFWKLTGFTVKGGNKGIVLDQSSHNVIDGVTVTDTRDEGVHFRMSSSDNVLQNSTVTNTGQGQPGFGEGVYLGSSRGEFAKFGSEPGSPDRSDRSDRNKVLNNKIGPGVAAELVDIKEGTVDGVVSGNIFDGTGVSGVNSADSWVDAKGNDYTIKDNRGTGPAGDLDGFQTHQLIPDFGCGNVFTGNTAKLNSPGFAINVTNQSRCGSNLNVVGDGNTVTGAGASLTNIE